MAGQPPLMRFTLQTSEETLELTLPPDGYREFSDEWNFSTNPFGFNEKTNSQKLRFVKEGADFLRRQLDLYGISADVNLIVERRRNNWTYEITFEGRLDFNSPYVNERDFFEIKAFEGGMKQALVEKNKTNFEIPLNDADAVDIEVPEGMKLYENISYNLTDYPHFPLPYGYNRGKYFPDIDFNSGKSSKYSKEIQFQRQEVPDNSGDFKGGIPSTSFLITKKSETYKRIYAKMDIKMRVIRAAAMHLGEIKVCISNVINLVNNNDAQVLFTIPTGFFGNYNELNGAEFSKSADFYFDINTDSDTDYYFFIEFSSGANTTDRLKFQIAGEFSVQYFGIVDTGQFSFKALSIENLGQKLLEKIHPEAVFLPQFIQEIENGYQLFLTSGDGIRGISEAVIKTNFSDFIKNLNCLYDIGVRPNNNEYYVAEKSKILNRDKELLDLGKVQEIKIEPLDDNWIFNGVKIGYEKQEYDYPLGRQEFAATLEFTNKLKIPNKVLDLVSKYRADYTGVHLLRYDYVNNDKKDSKSDNDIFWVLTFRKDNKWQAITGDYVNVLSGMEGGGYFNILLSPHWCLRRKAAYFSSILDKLPVKELQYTSGTETLSDLTSRFARGVIIKEKSDEIIPDSEYILFKPFTFEFDCIIPRNLAQLLGDSPSGYFRFQYNNIELKGFPIKVKGSYTDSRQTVTCLAHPDTQENIQLLLFKHKLEATLPPLPPPLPEYEFEFADGTTETEHAIQYNETFTDTIVSTKNGNPIAFTVSSKPMWANVTINGNIATITSGNAGEYREGQIVYQQTETGNTIVSKIKQSALPPLPAFFVIVGNDIIIHTDDGGQTWT
ncbi:MAG: hypothetical protein LBU37_04370 [Tannerellaceae bacterium]|jgi:hypothetical protein|nr:hypothetical protein [Tannerellaceae bacterium]